MRTSWAIAALGIFAFSACKDAARDGQQPSDQVKTEQKRAELQRNVAEQLFEVAAGRRLALNIRAGAATFPHDGATYEQVFVTADRRMR